MMPQERIQPGAMYGPTGDVALNALHETGVFDRPGPGGFYDQEFLRLYRGLVRVSAVDQSKLSTGVVAEIKTARDNARASGRWAALGALANSYA